MRLKWLVLFLFVESFLLFDPVVTVKSYAGDAAVAKVNGVELTEGQLEGIVNEILPKSFYHGTLAPERRVEARTKAMEELIKRELYYQEAKRLAIKLNKSEIDNEMKKIRERFASEKEFNKAIKASGFTKKTFQEYIVRNLVVSRFSSEEITRKAQISDESLKDVYEKEKKDFIRPESFKIRHILIKVDPSSTNEERDRIKKESEAILARARKGEDFAELAATYSMDDWRIKGGDLGIVHRGRLDPAIEEKAFKLDVGQISDLIETIYGYHIVKLEEKIPPVQLSFDEVKGMLRKKIEARRAEEIEKDTLKRLKDKAKIEVYEK